MAFSLEITGLVETRDRLTVLIAELEDMSGLWERYAEIMAASEAEWFASNGDGMWPPLAEDTLRDKLAHGYPPETLVRTGALVGSLTDPAQAMQVEGQTMVWGTSVADERGREYAHYHQHTVEGTMAPFDYGDRPPERQVIPWPLPAEVEAELLVADEDWLDDCIRRSALA